MYKRNWYDSQGYKPQLFYVIFGVNQKNLEISNEKYYVDKVPDKIQVSLLSKEDDEQKEYMSGFFKQQIGKFLQEKDDLLFEASVEAQECIVLRGEIKEDKTLEYFKDIIGMIQGLCDNGAISILDLHTLTWYHPKEWKGTMFEKEFNIYDHIRLLISEREDGLWIHTRGMSKFGRPDLSLLGIPKAGIQLAKDLADQFLFYLAKGFWFDKPMHLNITEGKFLLKPLFIEDFNNYDFNNAYVEVLFNDIVLVEQGTTM